MSLSMFNNHVKLKILTISKNQSKFASTIVRLRMFKEIKPNLVDLVIGNKWSLYKDDGVRKTRFLRQKIQGEIYRIRLTLHSLRQYIAFSDLPAPTNTFYS